MGKWQGHNYEEIPEPDDPKEAKTVQRRAMVYRRVKELGHPALFDADEKRMFARKYDISFRQVHYDLECVREFVAETINDDEHITNVKFVFEKAMAEAIQEGDWETAADIAEQEAEWMERRGVVENQQEENVNVEHSTPQWKKFIEGDGDFEELTDESGEIDVEVED